MNIQLLGEPEPSTALTVTARAAIALGSDKARIELAALVKKSASIKEIKNTAGRDECHGAAMALVKARTNIEKIGKAARDDATKFSKAVIAEEKALLDITTPEETRLVALRNSWDEARAAEKAEVERKERARIADIHLRIADLRDCAGLASQCKTSAEVEDLIDKMINQGLAGFDEFAGEAETTRTTTLARMKEISDAKFTEEQERARVKAEQEAERVRLAAERAELERERKESAERERIAAQERAKVEAEAKAARDAEEAAMARKRELFLAEVAAADKAQKQARAEFDAEVVRRDAEAKALAEPVVVIPAAQILASQPSDDEIFEAVAEYFEEEPDTARGWIRNMDFLKVTA